MARSGILPTVGGADVIIYSYCSSCGGVLRA